jgi:ribose 1,5-bisphosphokinase
MIFSKVLFFIGNSGSGKDTIMQALRIKLVAKGSKVIIPQRRITRPKHESENFISITPEEFNTLVQANELLLWWESYQTLYGYLKQDVFPFLDNQHYVFLNISRSVAFKADTDLPGSKFILIVAPKEESVLRIQKRQRDSENMIQERIKRMDEKIEIPPVFCSINNTSLAELEKDLDQLVAKLNNMD